MVEMFFAVTMSPRQFPRTKGDLSYAVRIQDSCNVNRLTIQ